MCPCGLSLVPNVFRGLLDYLWKISIIWDMFSLFRNFLWGRIPLHSHGYVGICYMYQACLTQRDWPATVSNVQGYLAPLSPGKISLKWIIFESEHWRIKQNLKRSPPGFDEQEHLLKLDDSNLNCDSFQKFSIIGWFYLVNFIHLKISELCLWIYTCVMVCSLQWENPLHVSIIYIH